MLVKDHNLVLDIDFFYRKDLYVATCCEDRNLMSMHGGRRYLITDGPESVFRDYGVLFYEPFNKKTTSSISFGCNNLKTLSNVIGWTVIANLGVIAPVFQIHNENGKMHLAAYNFHNGETYKLLDDKYIKNPPNKRMTMEAFSKELSDRITLAGQDCMCEIMSKYDLIGLDLDFSVASDLDHVLLIL